MRPTIKHALITGALTTALAGATLGVVGTAQAAAADAPLVQGHGRVIAGQYIVVLKDATAAAGASVASRNGVAAQHVYSHALNGFSARLSAAQLRKVRADKAVKYVEADQVVTLSKSAPGNNPTKAPRNHAAIGAHNTSGASTRNVQTGATWGLDRVDQRARPLNGIYRYTSTGAGVTAYIIDTGINSSHVDFGGRAYGVFTAVNDGNGTYDCNGHGTHVAGTIGGSTYGVAKGVALRAVRVLDCGGSGSYAGVIAGIDYVTYAHTGPSVANMSLGGGYSAAVNAAVTNSINEGVTYALAAGNSDDNACNYSPSSTPAALTVGATDSSDVRAYFSNFGSCVDVFAPGVSIKSDWTGSTTATNTISGTSMASPHVAGLVALYLQANPYATPATVATVIKQDASAGVVSDPAGSPNLLARKWNGTLSATGASNYEPDGSYWYQNAGYIRGWLQGTAGTDPDLYLMRWNGSAWVTVAGSASVTPQERITYNGTAGYYALRVYAYNGANTYDAWATHP